MNQEDKKEKVVVEVDAMHVLMAAHAEAEWKKAGRVISFVPALQAHLKVLQLSQNKEP